MKPKILISGANGYIGSALASSLIGKKMFSKLVCIGGPSKNPETFEKLAELCRKKKADAEFETASILDFQKIFRMLKGIDIAVHLASVHSVEACEKNSEESRKINLEGTQTIIRACEENSVKKFVFPSSFLVYGYAEGIITEKTPPVPENEYARQKFECERLCAQSRLDYVILRKANVFGTGFSQQFDNVIPKFVINALKEKKLTVYGSGMQKRNFLHISDAVRAYEKAIFSDYKGTLNIGGLKETRILDIAGIVAKKTNAKIVHAQNPRSEPEQRKWHLSSALAKKAIGFEAKMPLEKGLNEFIAWAKKNMERLP